MLFVDYFLDWSEIFEFWENVIYILVDIVFNDVFNLELVKEKLVWFFRMLIWDGKIDLVVYVVNIIC